jgi:hypothetical protein
MKPIADCQLPIADLYEGDEHLDKNRQSAIVNRQ